MAPIQLEALANRRKLEQEEQRNLFASLIATVINMSGKSVKKEVKPADIFKTEKPLSQVVADSGNHPEKVSVTFKEWMEMEKLKEQHGR